MDKEYKSISLNVLSSFQKNKERDLAILALLLASGVRLSEAVNLDLRDVNLNMMMIEVTRKGASGTRSMWQGLLSPIWKPIWASVSNATRLKKRIWPFSCQNTVVYPIALTLLPLRKWWLSTLRTSRYA